MQWDERIGRRLRLRDLHTLQVISETGSMAKAAGRLAVSQPAISKAVANLEHTLGVPVLDRTPRGVEVTAYGRALLRHAAVVFDDLRQGIAEIQFLRDPTQGELRIGAPEPITQVLSVIINDALAATPNIRFQVMVGDTAVLFEALRERQLDVALTRIPERRTEDDLETEVLFQDPLVVAAGTHNSWARQRRVSLADLVDQPWVLPPADTVLGRFGAEIFRARGLEPPRASVVTPSLQLRLSLMSSGPHLSLLPKAMLRFSSVQPAIAAIRLELPETERPVGLVRVKGRSMSPVLGTFVEQARKATSRIGANATS
ncbi:LysR family transcriptional regulator [Microvirga sp. GCM10011540]|uniref:LysR family transcriptional regulator n=1 Tax=Microvirga sp. GCM10011540 TaxID=3317338 RepID=UPI00360F3532